MRFGRERNYHLERHSFSILNWSTNELLMMQISKSLISFYSDVACDVQLSIVTGHPCTSYTIEFLQQQQIFTFTRITKRTSRVSITNWLIV